jgi:flagellin-like hook-associated protein FlgL
MINSIPGISASSVSQLSIQNQLISELDSQQEAMNVLEEQISTGDAFQLPSQNPGAAMQVESIQSLLQRYSQTQSSISTNQSYLSQTDSTLSSVSSLLTSAQAAALSAVGATANASERTAAVQEINQTIQQLVSLGNTTFNGRQLFGGTDTGAAPFAVNAAGNVVYSGSSQPTEAYTDLNQLSATSITGAQAFGAISQPIEGSPLTVALSPSTPLADLNGGQGVSLGSIEISDGQGNNSIVNLSGAQTLGDVATLIEQNPPPGRTVDVNVTPTGLTLQLEPDTTAYPSGDNLTVFEVNGGTTASGLGILNTVGVGDGQIAGQTLDAAVTTSTPLNSLFGSEAQANIHFGEPNSDIVLQANAPGATTSDGTLLNGVTVQIVADAPAAGQETATFDPGTPASGSSPGTPGTLTVNISTSAASGSRASQVVAAINAVPGLPFTASLDPSDQNGGGQPPLTAANLPTQTITTSGGNGYAFDTSGLQVTSNGQTDTVNVSGDQTVGDLLTSINSSGAGLDATINPAQNGINVSSRVSGGTFSIGENGGKTATQLGIRTFADSTPLSQLNLGAGVGVNTVAPGGTDFTITETLAGIPNPVSFNVSIAGDTTVGSGVNSVIHSINAAAQAAGAGVQAQLATTGNGIELVDTNPANGPITVAEYFGPNPQNTTVPQSTAAVDLGLIPAGQTSATSQPAATAGGSESSGPDSGLVFQAVNPGTAGNVQVVFQVNAGITEGNETVNYDSSANTLTFQISPQTTANDIIAALGNNPAASAAFSASLDTSTDPANNGGGVVQPQQFALAGGADVALTGSDTNPQQTDSVFTALLSLSTALSNNDSAAEQQAMTLLSNSMQSLGNARQYLGVQEQSLATITTQIGNDTNNLQSAMSTDYGTDMATAISGYTSAEIAYQATLQLAASTFRVTLLNYL